MCHMIIIKGYRRIRSKLQQNIPILTAACRIRVAAESVAFIPRAIYGDLILIGSCRKIRCVAVITISKTGHFSDSSSRVPICAVAQRDLQIPDKHDLIRARSA
ncbi:hypothetical protein D3C78_1710540 [compost metagenome]